MLVFLLAHRPRLAIAPASPAARRLPVARNIAGRCPSLLSRHRCATIPRRACYAAPTARAACRLPPSSPARRPCSPPPPLCRSLLAHHAPGIAHNHFAAVRAPPATRPTSLAARRLAGPLLALTAGVCRRPPHPSLREMRDERDTRTGVIIGGDGGRGHGMGVARWREEERRATVTADVIESGTCINCAAAARSGGLPPILYLKLSREFNLNAFPKFGFKDDGRPGAADVQKQHACSGFGERGQRGNLEGKGRDIDGIENTLSWR
ncbi:hypothetical protein C8R45DRAFT_1088881 [Mycena sanguinolenta]|nr:hypothetical protein C8R45DRAFT_1088881 [Mycena sanguinolenta]